MNSDLNQNSYSGPAFGSWLLTQQDRNGFGGRLATAAAGDWRFPMFGDPSAVRKWVQEQRASGGDWESREDAQSARLAS